MIRHVELVALLAVCAVIALGLGCALSDYGLMIDEYTGEVVDTQGVKAKIDSRYLQVAMIWPDGSDNLQWLVKQDPDGDRMLYTYNHFTTATTDPEYFYDFTFCHPGWNGCAIWVAADPEAPWDNPFDGTFNSDCSGARTLMLLFGPGYRYGEECGRNPFDLKDRVVLLESGMWTGDHTRRYLVTGSSSALYVDNRAGRKDRISIVGHVVADLDTRGRGAIAVDMTNPLLDMTLNQVADWADRYQTEGGTEVTVSFNGLERSFEVRLRAEGFRQNASRL